MVELYVLETVSHSFTPQREPFLSLVSHMQSKQCLTEAGKVRKRQCQRVRVGLAAPQTGQHNNVPYAVGEA